MMHKKEKRVMPEPPLSVGNLAVAHEHVRDLEEGKSALRPPKLRLLQNVAQQELDEEVEVDHRAPAKGILTGLLVSIAIWCLIALGILFAMS